MKIWAFPHKNWWVSQKNSIYLPVIHSPKNTEGHSYHYYFEWNSNCIKKIILAVDKKDNWYVFSLILPKKNASLALHYNV